MSLATCSVEESADALADYIAISIHIERWTGGRRAADRTVDSIRSFVRGLERSPHRGAKRDDLRPGLRIVPYKKSTAIAIAIDDAARRVTVLRVFYSGQDYEAVMGRRSD